MTKEEMLEVYERLMHLTETGRIQWKSAGEDAYSVSFPRSTAMVGTDEGLTDANNRSAGAFLKIFNDQGRLVSYASDLDLGEERNVLYFKFDPKPLLSAVIDGFYKYQETSQNILEELRKIDARQSSDTVAR
jgi:hypothetical protein